jgi:hypothetical protein
VGVASPGSQLVARRLADLETRRLRSGREGRVERGRQQPHLDGDLGRELHGHLARGDDPVRQLLGDRLVGIGAVGDELLEDRDRRRAASRDDLGEAGQAGHGGKADLLGQERGQLEVRVEAVLEAPVRLEQEPLAEHDGRVRLVGAERSGREHGNVAGRSGELREGCRGTADERRVYRSRQVAAFARPRNGRNRAALRDRDGQGMPRARAGRLRDQASSVVPFQGQRVARSSPGLAPARHLRDCEPGGAAKVERLDEVEPLDRLALAAEPALGAERGQVEARDRGRDLGPGELGWICPQTPELIITCFTTV